MIRHTIPDLDRLIAVGRGHIFPIRRPGDPVYPTKAAVEPGRFARNSIPDLDRLVKAHGSNALAIRRPRHSGHPIRVPSIGKEGMPCCRVPDLHGLIIAGGGDAFAVRRPHHSRDCVTMAAVYIIIYGEGIFWGGRSSLRSRT